MGYKNMFKIIYFSMYYLIYCCCTEKAATIDSYQQSTQVDYQNQSSSENDTL